MKPKMYWPSKRVVKHEMDEEFEDCMIFSAGKGSMRPSEKANSNKTNEEKDI